MLTRRLLRALGEERAPLAMGLAGLIFGIPVFFDVGIFVLAPLVYVAAKQGGGSILRYCLPLLAGLSVTHAFLPPHPGPVAAAGLLGVDLGWLILMGAACAIPAWYVGGVLFSSWIGKRIYVPVPEEMLAAVHEERDGEPSLGLVLSIIAVPLVLILAGTFGSIWLTEGSVAAGVANFIGTPAVALTVAVLLASWLLGYPPRDDPRGARRHRHGVAAPGRHDPARGRRRRVLRCGAQGHRHRRRRRGHPARRRPAGDRRRVRDQLRAADRTGLGHRGDRRHRRDHRPDDRGRRATPSRSSR